MPAHLLLERSKPVLEMVELDPGRVAGARQRSRRGRLRISAPHGMGRATCRQLLGQFMGYYPDVHISLHLTNRAVDLAEEGIDVALRFGPIDDDNLIVRKLMPMDLAVCAAPALLEEARHADASGRPAPARCADAVAPAACIRTGASRTTASRSTWPCKAAWIPPMPRR